MRITDFLLARIAEDEAAARAALDEFTRGVGTPPKWESRRQWQTSAIGEFIRINGPARVLAECAAKRIAVTRLDAEQAAARRLPAARQVDGATIDWMAVDILRSLAFPYADHPDFRDEWRP